MLSPRFPHDYPDRILEAEEALEPLFIRLIDDDVAVGMSRLGAAQRLERVLKDPAIDRLLADGIDEVRRAAIATGWQAEEIDAAMRSLAWHLVRASNPGAPD